MAKDKRYRVVKNLIEGGFIKSFQEIFDTIPKSVVYKDLGMNSVRFNKLLSKVENFVLKDIFRIAALIEVDKKLLLDLVYVDHIQHKKNGSEAKVKKS